MTVAWFHCFSGIAGDMALGSLLDAGADLDEVVAMLGQLGLDGWGLTAEPVLRCGIGATRAVVTVTDDRTSRTHADIVELLTRAGLPERITERTLAVFAALAAAEGRIHRLPVDQVHFHEVGGHDALIDVVGTVVALELLGVDEIRASPVTLGLGMVASTHGLLPNPAPAVVELLRGVPTVGRNTPVELVTPTGAAILAALASGFGPLPALRIGATGFGAGARDNDELPNCTQVVLGQRTHDLSGPALLGGSAPDGSVPGSGGDLLGQPVVELAANVDDATGEQLADAVVALLDAGAHDAWLTPIVMKKGRPGFTVHALCDLAVVGQVRRVLRAATGSFGVRGVTWQRWPSSRTMHEVAVAGSIVRVKVGPGRVKVEHDDAAAVAETSGRPLSEVVSLAEEAWRHRTSED